MVGQRILGRSLAGVVLSLWTLSGCGLGLESGAPRLSDLSFDGQAADQPLVLLFSMAFEDAEGDLGSGELRPLVNGRESEGEVLTLAEIMLASELSLAATSGVLYFSLEIDMDLAPATRPESGATFSVGVEATDGAGNHSNRPAVRLRIDYP